MFVLSFDVMLRLGYCLTIILRYLVLFIVLCWINSLVLYRE